MAKSHIGVCTWSLWPGNPHELVTRLRATGLDAVQFALSPMVHEFERWGDCITVLRSEGIRILSGMMAMLGEDYSTLEAIERTGGVRPNESWQTNLEHARRVAEIASAYDISLVTFHAGFLPEDGDDPERAKLLDRLRTIARLFEDHSLDIAFETGQETADTLRDVLLELDCSNVGVNFDPANMILYDKGDPIAALDLLAPFVRQIHIKDAVRTTTRGSWGTEVPAGQGDVDWKAFFEIARAIEPPVDFVIEREAGHERIADIVTAHDLVRAHLETSRV